MNLFGDFVTFSKHESSYFDLPASIVVVVAYLLPGLLSMVYSGFAYFATLILIAVAAFEKKSNMVKLYCLQFCFMSMFFNIIITALSLLARVITPLLGLVTLLSSVVAVVVIVVFIYSLYSALQYRFWKLPYLADFILNRFFR